MAVQLLMRNFGHLSDKGVTHLKAEVLLKDDKEAAFYSGRVASAQFFAVEILTT